MKQINLTLFVAVCLEVPDDYVHDSDCLFIENEELLLTDLKGTNIKTLEFETLTAEEYYD
jgi:hypothetical protein